MHSAVIAVLLLVTYCEAKPSFHFDPQPAFGSSSGSSYIIGGEDAKSGEFPWQISQQTIRNGVWSHNCGASLLSKYYALTAAHCVEGRSADIFRVVAGIIDRTSTDGVISNVASYKMHELYNTRDASVSDDIAIMTLTSPIYANGDTIQYAKLPDNGEDLFVGQSGYVSGWGLTAWGASQSKLLLKARMDVIDKERCNKMVGNRVDDTQICVYDENKTRGTCSSDSGGPFNLNNGSQQAIVAGVLSWVIGQCKTEYPSVYARTSFYLNWIKINTP